MTQSAGVDNREVRRGADMAEDAEFGAMESPAGEGEGQGLSPPVVRALHASLHASQFTQEQWGLIEEELQRRLAPMQQQSERDRQQMLGFQASNHALATELTAMHALDQGPRDLFPHDEWEDHRDQLQSRQHVIFLHFFIIEVTEVEGYP